MAGTYAIDWSQDIGKMTKALRRKARWRAAIVYSIVATLAVGLLEYRIGVFPDTDPGLIVPYVSVVLAATIFGAILGGWYFSETGKVEMVATPILVIGGAAFLAGQLHMYLTPLLLRIPADSLVPLAERMPGGLYATFYFLYFTSPILIPAAAFASYWLWWRYRTAKEKGAD